MWPHSEFKCLFVLFGMAEERRPSKKKKWKNRNKTTFLFNHSTNKKLLSSPARICCFLASGFVCFDVAPRLSDKSETPRLATKVDTSIYEKAVLIPGPECLAFLGTGCSWKQTEYSFLQADIVKKRAEPFPFASKTCWIQLRSSSSQQFYKLVSGALTQVKLNLYNRMSKMSNGWRSRKTMAAARRYNERSKLRNNLCYPHYKSERML